MMKRLYWALWVALLVLQVADASATATRPTKTFGGTSYIDGVVPRASDFNGDFDTIYSAFNSFESSPAFTGDVSSTKTTPCFIWSDSSQAADSRRWYACVTTGVFTLTTRTDAGTVQTTPISIARATGAITYNSPSPTFSNASPGVAFFNSSSSLISSGALTGFLFANGTSQPTVVNAATQTEMEAGSSTSVPVTPGRQQFHPSTVKAWGFITTSGAAPTLQASYNIASIADVATGKTRFTFITAMSTVNYSCVATGGSNGTTYSIPIVPSSTKLAASVEVWTASDASVLQDDDVGMACFGDQ